MPNQSFVQAIFIHLKQPEYIHVLLNPIPIYGIALGLFALILALSLRNRRAEIVALSLLFVGAVSTVPVVHYGDAGYDVIESETSSDQAVAWLDAHGQRALRAMPGFYALMAVTTLALVVPWKWPKSALPLNLVTLLAALVAFGLVGWIGFAGGQAMHPEFRSGSPSEPSGGYDKMR